jgi:hypothetical protein
MLPLWQRFPAGPFAPARSSGRPMRWGKNMVSTLLMRSRACQTKLREFARHLYRERRSRDGAPGENPFGEANRLVGLYAPEEESCPVAVGSAGFGATARRSTASRRPMEQILRGRTARRAGHSRRPLWPCRLPRRHRTAPPPLGGWICARSWETMCRNGRFGTEALSPSVFDPGHDPGAEPRRRARGAARATFDRRIPSCRPGSSVPRRMPGPQASRTGS